MGPQRVELAQYLQSVQHQGFILGVWDCHYFTNSCWRILYGKGWSEDWLGKYSHNGILLPRKQLREVFGFQTFLEGVDSKLRRGPAIPAFGSLAAVKSHAVFIGYALGITLGDQAVFVKERGLQYLPIQEVEHTWVHDEI